MYKGYKIIALCISKAGNNRHLEFIQALNKSCIQNNYRLFIYHTCSDLYRQMRCEEGEKAVFELINYDITDAVIIFDEAFLDKTVIHNIIARATATSTPVICVGAQREQTTSFLFNYDKGFEEVARHIIEHHHAKNICFIAGREIDEHSNNRIEVYKKILTENNLDFSKMRLFYGDYWWFPTQTAVEQIISSGDIPDAIICANDTMAITTVETLHNHGFHVPDDIIVSGFDGILEAKCCSPAITTCKCDLAGAATRIIEVLNDIFIQKPTKNTYEIDYTIDIYRSCGCGNEKDAPLNMGELLKYAEDVFIRYQEDERTFYEMSEKIMECISPHSFSEYIAGFNIFDTCIMVNSECFDDTINPTAYNHSFFYEDTMQILYHSDSDLKTMPKPFNHIDILPDLDTVLDTHKTPLIFNALSVFGHPIGYICFYFALEKSSYCKIQQYVTSLNNAIGSYRFIHYLKHAAQSMERMSRQDFMTGLCNRKGFYNQLPAIIDCAKQQNKHLMVATIDIDGLKHINDTYGHEEGDFAIKSVANTILLLPFFQKICGRFGGDEFVVCALCDGIQDEASFKSFILGHLQAINETSQKPYRIASSVGAYAVSPDNFDFEITLKESDDRMYIMKIGHPNRRRS